MVIDEIGIIVILALLETGIFYTAYLNPTVWNIQQFYTTTETLINAIGIIASYTVSKKEKTEVAFPGVLALLGIYAIFFTLISVNSPSSLTGNFATINANMFGILLLLTGAVFGKKS